MNNKIRVAVVIIAVIFFISVATVSTQDGVVVAVPVSIADVLNKSPILKLPQPEPVVTVSSREMELLARLVTAEAGGECKKAKIGVVNVVLNRLKAGWAKSITAVIYQKHQFSPVSNGSINCVPTVSSREAVREAVAGKVTVGTTLYFWSATEVSRSNHIWRRTVRYRYSKTVFAGGKR